MAKNEECGDERDIVLRVRKGDRDAFGLLVSQHMRRAYYAAVGIVGHSDDALDLSQDAFVRAYRARAKMDPERPFYTWYYQILRRLCFNHVRNRGTRRARLEQHSPWLVAEAESRGAFGPDDAARRDELRSRVQVAVENLAAEEREIIVLREFQDLRYKEIASLLDVPIGTVMSRLYAARKKLAKQLEDLE